MTKAELPESNLEFWARTVRQLEAEHARTEAQGGTVFEYDRLVLEKAREYATVYVIRKLEGKEI